MNVEEYLKFLINKISKKIDKEDSISDDSLIRQDLGIDGDDADLLLEEICSRYSIQMEDFLFQDFFNPEPNLLDHIRIIFGRRRSQPSRDMRFSELVNIVSIAIKTGAYPSL